MILTERTVTIRKGVSAINMPIHLYRGDYEIEVRFVILNSKFLFRGTTNFIETNDACFGQLAILKPDGDNIFSNIVPCVDGTVSFVITKTMADELSEIGEYSFHIRLYDENQVSRVSIPPVQNGIMILEPIASEDHTNVVGEAITGYALANTGWVDDSAVEPFDEEGKYNQKEWVIGDRITTGAMNKIESAINTIHTDANTNVTELNNRMISNYNVLDSKITMLEETDEELASQLAHIKSFTINVKDYGAKGDGITDDTIAIKKAIEEAELLINDRLTDGAIVFFPQGKYVVSDTLNIMKSGINLKGESISTTIKDIGSTNILIKFNGDLTIYRSGLSNLTISSNNQQKNLILIDRVINCMFENLVISNSYDCFNLKNAGKVYFSNIILTQDNTNRVSRYGFDITDGNDVHFTNVQIFANATPNLSYSMIIRACDGLYFSNSHWHGTVLLSPINNKTLASVFFDNCYFDRGYSACLEIQGATTNPYRNFMFSNCYFREAKKGVIITPTSVCELIQFTGCSFTQNTMDGVYIESQVENIIFNGCSFADNNTNNSSDHGHIISNGNYVSINGCQFVRGGEIGYGVKSAGSYNNISNNNFKNCNGDKLNISGSSNNVTNNAGVIKKKVGSATIQAGQTEILVKHGLTGITSEMIMITPRSLVTTNYRIAWVDETSFRILINSAESNSIIFTYWIDANLYN